MFPRLFTDHRNYLSPSPNWQYQTTNLPVSTTAPLDESELGSMQFELWKEIGGEFLMKNTINNWLYCVPNGGSLVEMIDGPVLCNVTKVIVEGLCEDTVPYTFEKHGQSAGLFSSSRHYDYLYTKGKHTWPVSDPCGRTHQNQLKTVLNPAGWIYVREQEQVDFHIIEIFDTKNKSSK